MTFQEAVVTCFRKYADFKGRASHSEYRWFALFTRVVGGSAFVAFGVLALLGHPVLGLAVVLPVGVVLALPMEAVIWRRYHDMGRSGAWSFLKTGLWRPGDPGWNMYGPPPGGEVSVEHRAATSTLAASRRVTPTRAAPSIAAVFVPCPGCGKVINREVGRCPYCRSDLEANSRWGRRRGFTPPSPPE
jgi:predicted RNA-binding Zn-ribbon protein involved in translation (DUF1610 family)